MYQIDIDSIFLTGVRKKLKYLGITTQIQSDVSNHTFLLCCRARSYTRALRRSMSNLSNDPVAKIEHFTFMQYSLFCCSVIWRNYCQQTRKLLKPLLQQIVRLLAQRVISAYKMVLYDAATLLAKSASRNTASIRKRILFRTKYARLLEILETKHKN